MTDRRLSPPANLDVLHKRVWIMGVLNVTPDSFYAGSRASGPADAAVQAERMIAEGADILDIGGESTRPGAAPVPAAEELTRVLPVLETIHERWPDAALSIDTQKADVAREALARGASLVNDVSALRHDPEMAGVIADSGCGVVLMHMQGTPETMQRDPRYADVIDTLKSFFEERLAAARRQGIREENIVLDPGIGFGKTLEHNLTILKNLSALKVFGRPVLVGISRKSFIGKLMGQAAGPENRLEGTLAATLWALQAGAQGVRVHDVGMTRQAVSVWQTLGGAAA